MIDGKNIDQKYHDVKKQDKCYLLSLMHIKMLIKEMEE